MTYPPLSERSSTLHHCRDLNSVYMLHEAVERLKAAVQREREGHRQRRPNESVTVHMGRSRVFQKLVLSSQDISVFIYRQKSVKPLIQGDVYTCACTCTCTCTCSTCTCTDLMVIEHYSRNIWTKREFLFVQDTLSTVQEFDLLLKPVSESLCLAPMYCA